jgi:hypothetical protein
MVIKPPMIAQRTAKYEGAAALAADQPLPTP